jgi:hypothetical protein
MVVADGLIRAPARRCSLVSTVLPADPAVRSSLAVLTEHS